jgi:TPR repeat protein
VIDTAMTRLWAAIRRIAAAGLCAAALLLAAPQAWAGFADGVKAYEAGDYAGAYAAWAPLAERGDVAAMRNLGHLYRWGQGVERDIQQAMHWYRRAAETGFARAQANLAAIYLQGDEGVSIDYAEAHKWFEAAARQGHAVAQYNLGLMYELGLGVEKNEAIALGWYNNAAKTGQPDALERLSLLVMRRDGNDAAKPLGAAAVPKAAGGDDKTESDAAAAPANPSVQSPPAQSPAVQNPPVQSPAAENQAPASAEQAAKPADAGAGTDSKTEAETQADVGRESPGLLGRFYSAIASGGGVSIPDLFNAGENRDDTEKLEPEGRPGAETETRP